MLGPIFVREWRTLPRRSGHYAVRTVYLAFLWVIGLTAWQLAVGWGRASNLGDNARFGPLLFQVLAYVQLGVFLFFTALSAAGAVAQEKDRRTFLLLLLTDLRDNEIVLGKLAGALLPFVILLLGSLPVLASVVLLGGVVPGQVGEVALVLAATALAAGSLGCVVALRSEQTFPSLAMTFLGIVLYLCLVRAFGLVGGTAPLQAYLDPLTALQNVLDPPLSPAGLSPVVGFAGAMLGLSAALNAIAMWRLRAWNPRGEPVQQRERPGDEDDKDRRQAHAAPGPVRRVWPNPILWREIRTRAYGRRPLLVQTAYLLAFGLLCAYAFSLLNEPGGRVPFAAAYGLVPTAVLSLLLVSAQAVSSITRERDLRSLDLLLVTDLTPREFVFGKLGGIAYNVAVYLLPLLLLAGYYAWRGGLASPPRGRPAAVDAARNVQVFICVSGTLLVLAAFASVLGLHVGLRTEDSRAAVVRVLGTVFFLAVGTFVCIGLIVVSGRFEWQWGSFVLFSGAAVAGLWWVLNGERPSTALTIASWLCPFLFFYAVLNVLIGKPGTDESSEPWLPFLAVALPFGFAIWAMLVPLLSEFDLALGRTGEKNE